MASLYVDRKGTSIKLSGEALVFYENEERVGTVPLAPIDHIYLRGDVTLQASLLAKLGEQNVGVICLSGRKNTPTLLLPSPHNDAERRMKQYELAQNEVFCLAFAQKVVLLKLQTQIVWLTQAAEKRSDKKLTLLTAKENLRLLQEKIADQTTLAALRGIEGRAAAIYFSALSAYLPSSLHFEGRNRRPPKDPFNAVLSLAYTLLHSEAVLASYGAGLDPYIGFYHSLDYGRESLACDLIETLRPLVDNWLLGCFRQEVLRVEHFSHTQEGCFLGKTGRVNFYQAYEKQIQQWRKMLTESCFDLVKVLQAMPLVLPQAKTSEVMPVDIHWQNALANYQFNQQTMFADWEFAF